MKKNTSTSKHIEMWGRWHGLDFCLEHTLRTREVKFSRIGNSMMHYQHVILPAKPDGLRELAGALEEMAKEIEGEG